jgi:HSP20 family protein
MRNGASCCNPGNWSQGNSSQGNVRGGQGLFGREWEQLVKEIMPVFEGVSSGRGNWNVPWDIVESKTGFELVMDLPGIAPEEVQVEFHDGVLTVSGQRAQPEQPEGRKVHLGERRWGSFSRSVKLPEVDGEKISAEFKLGVLTIVAPKLAATTARKIEIKLS